MPRANLPALSQRALGLLGLLGLLGITVLLGRAPGGRLLIPTPVAGSWVYLSDLPWERTSTEWLMVANEGIPSVDAAFFTNGPLLIGEHAFAKGLGTHAPSEIVYQLNGGYSRLEVEVGLEEDGPSGAAAAQFLLFADGTKIYESPVRTAADPPLPVRVPLFSVDELRLVTLRAEDATRGARVAWADARLLHDAACSTAALGCEPAAQVFVQWLKDANVARTATRAAAEQRLDHEARTELELVRDRLGGAFPGPDDRPRWTVIEHGGQARATLVNNRLAISIGLGGERHAGVSVIDVTTGRYVARDLGASVQWSGGSFDLGRDTRPVSEDLLVEDTDHPVFGQGTQLTLALESRGGYPFDGAQGTAGGAQGTALPAGREGKVLQAAVKLVLFRDQPVLLSRFQVDGLTRSPLPLGEGWGEGTGELEVRHLETGPEGGFLVGERTNYLAELTRLRHVVAQDDGIKHQDRIAWGKPVYLWDDESGEGLLVAVLTDTPSPPVFTFQRQPGEALARTELRSSRQWCSAGAPACDGATSLSSGWLYLEKLPASSSLSPVEGPQEQFSRYRSLIAHLFPAPELPVWFKYQWLSWYVYYTDINEEVLVRQIDQIAQHFGDLGPWHIIVDAGWYIAEGREDSEWRNQDFEKFPRGLRWLVDYAHRKGVKVVLYFTAPYLNNREEGWNWLGLRGLIDQHPDWVIPLDEAEPFEDFAYDFQNPELRAYMAGIMRDYMIRYNVDGIKLDGLGSAGESVLYSPEGATFSLSERALAQTMDIYRFVWEHANRWKDDVYVESGWINPLTANSYAHTFRYGDEEPLFTRPYPLPGLIEHIDYSAYQQALLGQRSNMGAIYGDPNESPVNLWWLGAALAMGTQVSLSVDMEALTPESISLYRSFLAPYRPFQGTTRADPSLKQHLFHTRICPLPPCGGELERGHTWYVGMLNREASARRIAVDAPALGLPPGSVLFAYDVESGRSERGVGAVSLIVEPESFRLLVVRTQPGVIWTNSRVEALVPHASYLIPRTCYRVHAPPTVNGRLHLYAPETPTIYWNGVPLAPSTEPSEAEQGYTYDEVSGLLTVWYPPGGTHLLTIE